MNRRHFLGQVVLGSAAVSTLGPSNVVAGQATAGLKINFVGMMGYISRTDGSILVAMPGHHPMGHYSHVPFLMARTGSAIANALGMTSMPGVVAGAFDNRLVDAPANAFVFRCLEGADLEIDNAGAPATVDNRATHLAQMYKIAGGKRIRNDIRRWSNATVTLRGGRLENAAAHPDAGKIWSFGSHSQPLTDATLYTTAGGSIRLVSGNTVLSHNDSDGSELWIVSSAGPRTDVPDPKRLEHGAILFEYFADAEPVTATCAEAEGRITLATDLPCSTATASTRSGAALMAPPYLELCYGGGWCGDCV